MQRDWPEDWALPLPSSSVCCPAVRPRPELMMPRSVTPDPPTPPRSRKSILSHSWTWKSKIAIDRDFVFVWQSYRTHSDQEPRWFVSRICYECCFWSVSVQAEIVWTLNNGYSFFGYIGVAQTSVVPSMSCMSLSQPLPLVLVLSILSLPYVYPISYRTCIYHHIWHFRTPSSLLRSSLVALGHPSPATSSESFHSNRDRVDY